MKLSDNLRDSILDAAFKGKITNHNSTDNSVQFFLNSKKIKCVDKDLPFEIPSNWCFVYFKDVTTYLDKKEKINSKEAAKDLWLLDLEDIEKGGSLLNKKKVGDKKAIGDKTVFHKGDILYSKLRPYLKKVLIADEDGICTPELVPFTSLENIKKEFLVYYLKSPYVDSLVNKASYGVKMPRVSPKTMSDILIPVPPVEEQERIVLKLNELMTKIGKFEDLETKAIDSKLKFQNDIKASLLNAAMQGKLTNDFKDLDLDDLQMPKSWDKKPLSKVADIYTGNSIPESIKKSKYMNCKEGYSYIGTKDVGFDKNINYENGVIIPFSEPKFKIAYKNAVLLCIEGGSAGKKIGIVDRDVCFGNKLCSFNKSNVYPKYLYYYLQSPMFLKIFYDNLSGMIGGVSVNKIKRTLIPIPSYNEQIKIAELLDQLLSKCNNLLDD